MRALFSGSLNFGLVNIPIKLYSAVEDHDLPLHQVHAEDGGRIRYRKVCEVCGETVDRGEIVKAYESDDSVVILNDEDFASLPSDKSKQVSVEQFAPADQIAPLLIDHAYYLEPSAAGAKAYALLRGTLEKTDRVAIVRFALRQRTQLGVLRVHGDVLAVQTLHWPDEVRSFELPDKVVNASVTDRELAVALTLVDSYAADFEPDQFSDDYRDEMEALVEAKLAGGEAFEAAPEQDDGRDAEVVDLLAALERSVERRGGRSAGRGGGRGGGASSRSRPRSGPTGDKTADDDTPAPAAPTSKKSSTATRRRATKAAGEGASGTRFTAKGRVSKDGSSSRKSGAAKPSGGSSRKSAPKNATRSGGKSAGAARKSPESKSRKSA